MHKQEELHLYGFESWFYFSIFMSHRLPFLTQLSSQASLDEISHYTLPPSVSIGLLNMAVWYAFTVLIGTHSLSRLSDHLPQDLLVVPLLPSLCFLPTQAACQSCSQHFMIFPFTPKLYILRRF